MSLERLAVSVAAASSSAASGESVEEAANLERRVAIRLQRTVLSGLRQDGFGSYQRKNEDHERF
jgi:uncharacterized protein (DUF4415 family)